MRKIIIICIFISPLLVKGQDPSFSQFDLNLMYNNPSLSGFEGTIKTTLHSRNQWNYVNENFNNSIFEISGSIRLNPNSRKYSTRWTPGIGVISEDLGFTNFGNTVFVNRNEVSIYPASFNMKIQKNIYLCYGASINLRKYSLNSDNLIFTDQWSAFGSFNPISGSPINKFINDDLIVDGAIGFTLVRQGRYQSTQTNRLTVGMSLNHISKPNESLFGNQSDDTRIPLKQNIHAEWFYGFPKVNRVFIPYVKTLFNHERYSKENVLNIFKASLISKTEFGGTAFINNLPIETGFLWRICHNYETKYYSQTLVWVFRYRFSRNNTWMINYSYDANINSNLDNLNFVNTGQTHEMGIAIYLTGGKSGRGSGGGGNNDCPAFMENSALYKDIYNNGLVNNKSRKRNFKIR